MVTGTVDSVAGTHTVMQYGDRNRRECCWHTHCNAVCVLPFKLRCLLCRCTVTGTATWLWTVFGCLLLWTDETQIRALQWHIIISVMWHLTFSVLQRSAVSVCQHTPKFIPTFLSGYVLPGDIVNTNWQSVTYRSAVTVNEGILPVINNNYWIIG